MSTLDRNPALRITLYFLLVLLISNLGAMVDRVLHPDIPYFDREHLIVGGVTAITMVVLLGGLEAYLARRRVIAAALSESEARYRLLAENSSDVVFLAKGGGLTWISPSMTALSGWLPEQLLGLSLAELVHPDDLPRLALLRDDAGNDRAELRLRLASGEHEWLSIKLSNLVDADGEPILVGGAQGIQAEVEGRQALAESERRYRALSESSPDFIFVLDRELRVRYLNKMAANAFGRTAEELVGAALADLFDSETAAGMSASQRTVFESGEPRHSEFSWRGPWGRKWLATWLVPIHDKAGEVVEVFGVARDFTDLKRAEGELDAANAELEERVAGRTAQLEASNKELEAFVYSASHDLRAPLRAIDGFSQMVIDDARERLTDDDVEHLQRVRAAAQRMALLMDELLGLSRASRGDLLRERLDVSALAAAIAEELREAEPDRQVEVAITPGMHAEADAAFLRAILANLLDNAWKFTARREIAHVAVGVTDAGSERAFFVRDDGAGFDMKAAVHLFGAFQRYHREDEFKGDGIGLATVQRLVAKHGGRVWAEAEVEKGATLYFTLPEAAASV